MKPQKIIISFDGTKKLYDLVKEYVVYKLDNEDENYNASSENSENGRTNAATLDSRR